MLVLIALLMSFASCKKEQTKVEREQTKIVKIDSNPQGATVFIDNNEPITPPAEVELTVGFHFIKFRKTGYQDFIMNGFEVKGNTTLISATLEKLPSSEEMAEFGVIGPIAFDSVPHFACCSAAAIAYSDIFYNCTYTVSGATVLDSFDIVFPSGKVAHFDTKKVSYRIRKFSKVVTFDESGDYKIVSNNETKFQFEVCYKPTILPPTPKMEDLFPEGSISNAISVPVGEEIAAKILITDAKGNPIKNTSLGVYDFKTDNDGIVNFKAKVVKEGCDYCYKIYVNGHDASIRVYADLLIFGYDYAKFSNTGELIESSMLNVKSDTKVVYEGSDVFIPYGSFGLKIREIYPGTCVGGDLILPHPKNPSTIYTNTFVSKDGGNHFEKLGASLDAIAIHPENPEVVLGWSRNTPDSLIKSTDYGLHFEKISNININLINNFVNGILIDPKNTQNIYLATWKGLYVSTNGDNTFKPIIQNQLIYMLAISPKDSNIIFVSSEKGIMKSEDGGKTFKLVRDSIGYKTVSCIAFDPKEDNTIYAGGTYELLKSSDGGQTWEALSKFDLEGNGSVAINPVNNHIVCVASFRDGIYVSRDFGKHFTKIYFLVDEETSVAFDSKGNLLVITDGVPYKMNSLGNFIPLGPETFLIGGPNFNIIDGRFFIDIAHILMDNVKINVTKDSIEIYKACDMVP